MSWDQQLNSKTYAKTSSELNFEGHNIFVGIDLHLKSWTVTILTEKLSHKTFTQPASVGTLHGYIENKFLGRVYHSVYVAGFSGLCGTEGVDRRSLCRDAGERSQGL